MDLKLNLSKGQTIKMKYLFKTIDLINKSPNILYTQDEKAIKYFYIKIS